MYNYYIILIINIIFVNLEIIFIDKLKIDNSKNFYQE